MCEPCTYSQGPEVDYLPTSFSDTSQLSLLSGNHTPAKSCENAQPKDGSPTCQCGKGTFDCSIHPSTPDEWIASMQDSLARIFHSLETKPGLKTAQDRAFTVKSSASLASLSPDNSFWKTSQQSFLTDSEPYSQTWPRWGMTQGGYAYELPMLGQIINAIDGGSGQLWQTPVADDAVNRANGKFNSRGEPKLSAQVLRWPTPKANDAEKRGNFDMNNPRNGLPAAVKRMPTPSANDWKGSSKPGQRRGQLTDPAMGAIPAGGKLNPTWVEWLMAFPLGFTVSRHWVTPKSRSKPQPLGDCLAGSE